MGALVEEVCVRQVWYCVAMSLDGFIGGPKGEYDWIPAEPEIDWGTFMGRFDTVLIGRRSYDAALAGPGIMPGMQTFVFSRTLRAEDHPGVTIVNDDNLADTLASLRRTSGKEIWLFGGGDLFRSLLQLGEVDKIEVGLAPVLLGQGIPFLPGLNRIAPLRLIETRRYPSGILMLTYDVAKV